MTDPDQLEQVARALYVTMNGPWASGQGITEGGTPWGTTREQDQHEDYLRKAAVFLGQMGDGRAAPRSPAPVYAKWWPEEADPVTGPDHGTQATRND
jgi:hypothetical protein